MNPKIEETSTPPKAEDRRIGFFERYLSAWVALCMAAGILLAGSSPRLRTPYAGSNSVKAAR